MSSLMLVLRKLLNKQSSGWWFEMPWCSCNITVMHCILQIIAFICCLTAPRHYLNQCLLITSGVLWYSTEINFALSGQDINIWNGLENYTSEIKATSSRGQCVDTSWSRDAIWRHRSGSPLVQVMACCLTAPSHYLNQCWFTISKVHWHSFEYNFTRDTWAIN